MDIAEAEEAGDPVRNGPGTGPGPGPGAAAAEADAAARFVAELSEHWRRYGKAAFDAALSKDPVRYVALAAKLMAADAPREQGADLVALLAALDDGK